MTPDHSFIRLVNVLEYLDTRPRHFLNGSPREVLRVSRILAEFPKSYGEDNESQYLKDEVPHLISAHGRKKFSTGTCESSPYSKVLLLRVPGAKSKRTATIGPSDAKDDLHSRDGSRILCRTARRTSGKDLR